MATWLPISRTEGTASRQAHADLPAGTFERELGREGFYGPSTQMYHRHPPTGWTHVEGPLRPRAFDASELPVSGSSPWDAHRLLGNASLQLRLWRTQTGMDHLVRNGDGDELLFVHQGTAELFCDYGHLRLAEGDYLLLPRGTLWRIEVSGAFSALLIEATGESFGLPTKGIVGSHAVFDPAVLEAPAMDEAFATQMMKDLGVTWPVPVKPA